MTLDRPWDGPSGTVYAWHASLGGVGVAGKGQQPFILGIKTFQMAYGAKMPGSLGTNYKTLATNAANWIKNNGYDPVSGGLYYARIFQQCNLFMRTAHNPKSFLLPLETHIAHKMGQTALTSLS